MDYLKRLFVLVLIATVVSLGGIGCQGTSESPPGEQPAEDHPSDEHPSSEHPSEEHPTSEHPE